MRRSGAVLALACAFGCRPHSATLAGHWKLCVSDSVAHRECGTAVVAASKGSAFRFREHYPFTHNVDLRAVPNLRSDRRSCGSLLVDEDSTITILLGIACGTLFEADGGNLAAEHLVFRDDTIAGAWYQSCFSGCTARGTLSMTRTTR